MFFLGIFSYFQILILPGSIILILLKYKTKGPLNIFLLSMGLSLYFNFIVVIFFTALKIYTSLIVYLLFTIELFLLVALVFRRKYNLSWLKISFREFLNNFISYLNNLSFLHKILFITTIILLIFFCSLIPDNLTNILYFNDALVRNNWVVDWASNMLPQHTGHYPQLLPANMSLAYVFTQSKIIEFFPKAITPFFFLGILLIFFDLSFKEKPLVYLTSFIIYSAMLIIFYSIMFITSANADIPTAFLGFLVFYTIKTNNSNEFEFNTILLVILFATSSANTKLAGMFIVGLSMLWVVYYTYKNKESISNGKIFKTAVVILFLFVLNFVWYIIKPNMRQGLGESPFMVTSTISDKIAYGTHMLFFSFGPILSLFLIITLILALFKKESKYIVVFMIFPITALWVFLYNYDYRNLSIILPFVAYASALGLQFLYKKVVNEQSSSSLNKICKNEEDKTFSKKRYYLYNAAFALMMFLLYLAISSDFFLNFGIEFSYFLHKYYFHYNRVIFFTEVGYYKYVDYYVAAFETFIIVITLIFILRKSKIRLWHLIFSAIIIVNCIKL